MRWTWWMLAVALGRATSDEPTGDSPDPQTEDSDAAEEVDLEFVTNTPEECPGSSISAGEGENGHWAVSRLTPPVYPWRVDEVAYQLLAEGSTAFDDVCGLLDHRVALFIGGDDPAREPVFVEEGAAADLTSEEQNLGLVWELEGDIVVEEGESVYVMIEMRIDEDAGERSCIIACVDGGDDDRNLWSNAAEAPYDWATLASFGLDYTYAVGLRGTPL